MQRGRRVISILLVTLALAACNLEEDQDFVLYTHCGIDDLQFEGQWYERVGGLLDDGSGNPPGWDNAEQEGILTRVDEVTLVLSDEAEHREEFVLRVGAAGPKQSCD